MGLASATHRGITETIVAHVHRGEHDRSQITCPRCDGVLPARARVCRTIDTMVGPGQLERRYFYCRPCRVGRYPFDEALGVGEGCKQLDMHKAAANLGTEIPYDPRSRSQVEPCDFCVRRGMFSRLGVQDGQKCPLKDSNVVAIMLTTPCRVSGDHPSLTLFAKILLPLVSLTLYVGWNTGLFAGKYPMFTYSP